LIATQVTGPDGRFLLSVEPQDLILKVRKPGYGVRTVEFKLKDLKSLSKLDIELSKS
jgi:hypothetical protein